MSPHRTMVRPPLPLILAAPQLLLLLTLFVPDVTSHCAMSDEVCEFWLEVEYHLTMMHREHGAVYAHNSKLYRYDVPVDDLDTAEPIDLDDVIITDGWETPKLVVVANGTMPGPAIEVYEGQTVLVHVTNRMRSDAVTLHWHGMHQVGTPWMDGVAFVTQCPISPGQSFTYRFKATPKGTFWYHSHIGSQLGMGLVGALIVREKKATQMGEHIMLLQDWNHSWDADVSHLRMDLGSFVNRVELQPTSSLDGSLYSQFLFTSGLINGLGRYFAETDYPMARTPLTVYHVERNQQYRFRVIGGGNIYPFRVSVDDHMITVVASDGYDLQPLEVESFIINPGERFDFLLEANRVADNYWIRAETLEVDRLNHVALAILRYDGAPDADPDGRARNCSATHQCLVLNCPFKYYPEDEHTVCKIFSEADSLYMDDVPTDHDVEDIFLNFAFPGYKETPASVNGVQFVAPPSPPLTQPQDLTTACRPENNCGEQRLCQCALSLDLQHGKAYQFVFTNLGTGKGWAHPVHMHGHSFHVVKMGYPSYNQTTGKILADNPDIDCRGNVNANESFCNAPAWANGSWSGNTVPDLKLTWAPRKDTIMVPSGGYTVVRIRADNPGVWFLHCHIELHHVDGMAVMLNESFERHPAPPKGFPTCGNFDYSGLSDGGTEGKDAADKDEGEKDDPKYSDLADCLNNETFWAVAGGFAALVFLHLVTLFFLCLKTLWSPRSQPAKARTARQPPSTSTTPSTFITPERYHVTQPDQGQQPHQQNTAYCIPTPDESQNYHTNKAFAPN